MVIEANYKECEPARVLAVDDHQVLIDGLKSLLKKDSSVQFAFEANSGEEALQMIEKHHHEIDLIMTDISMNGISGLDLTKEVKSRFPHIKILVLSMYNEPEVVDAILSSEAEGYILKNSGKAELQDAIRKICQGSSYYSTEVISSFMRHRNGEVKKHKKDIRDILTTREVEIVQLICEELTTAEIAERLFISPRTVDTHRKHILEKTDSKSVVSLIKLAYEYELIGTSA